MMCLCACVCVHACTCPCIIGGYLRTEDNPIHLILDDTSTSTSGSLTQDGQCVIETGWSVCN